MSLQMLERGFFKSQIQLASQNSMGGKPQSPGLPSALANPDVQVLRVGRFNHPRYGEFSITAATLAEMKKNFDDKVRGVDIAFDYFHESDKEASGWPTELYLNEEGSELWAKVDWTPAAQQKLQEREIRYFSPDFAFEWEDPETGVVHKNVLFGGGLTNRPFVKEMAPIVAAEIKEEQMTIQELEKKVMKLAEDGGDLAKKHEDLQKEHEVLKKKLAEYEEVPKKEDAPPAVEVEVKPEDDSVDALKKKLDEANGRADKLEKELMEMKEGKKLAEKEASFNVLLTEGKACVAQKKAYMSGDMSEFAKLSRPLNLSERGSVDAEGSVDGDASERILKLAEAKVKADPKLKLLDAISQAQREVR